MPQYDTPNQVSAVIDVPAGHVRFIAADRTDTTVEVLPADPSKSRDVKAAEQVSVTYDKGVLRIESAPAKNRVLGSSSGAVEVTVQLPAGSNVEGKTAAVELRGVGRLGDVTFDNAQGSVKVDEAASVRLTVLAGDVSLGRLSGPAEITTSKGDIRIAEASRGTLTLRTEQGEISVGAARGVSATLDAGTSYGRVSNSLKNADGAAAGLTIHATTAYGDIAARSL
ncbi:DUF4097 family beta strand repeat-containing protein [Streptomyces sp. NPDC057074]|uniref:DUF4097 family beta strand repeat-containing protein n=1 Tax=Streptomyces sp. NPDC057074 TaxID=3346015 RepID=UPI00363917AE